jgi:hypothetical protein
MRNLQAGRIILVGFGKNNNKPEQRRNAKWKTKEKIVTTSPIKASYVTCATACITKVTIVVWQRKSP